jgi:hypothetical protein
MGAKLLFLLVFFDCQVFFDAHNSVTHMSILGENGHKGLLRARSLQA